MNLEKQKDFFVHQRLIYKNLPLFLHRHLIVGEKDTSVDPIFSEFREAVNLQVAEFVGTVSTSLQMSDDRRHLSNRESTCT
jgi:hypothetical protein